MRPIINEKFKPIRPSKYGDERMDMMYKRIIGQLKLEDNKIINVSDKDSKEVVHMVKGPYVNGLTVKSSILTHSMLENYTKLVLYILDGKVYIYEDESDKTDKKLTVDELLSMPRGRRLFILSLLVERYIHAYEDTLSALVVDERGGVNQRFSNNKRKPLKITEEIGVTELLNKLLTNDELSTQEFIRVFGDDLKSYKLKPFNDIKTNVLSCEYALCDDLTYLVERYRILNKLLKMYKKDSNFIYKPKENVNKGTKQQLDVSSIMNELANLY